MENHRTGNRIYYCASFTIEAVMVLSVVFFTFALLLRYAYVKHDTVTGTMILEEMLEDARQKENKDLGNKFFEEKGEKLGNPRLWLGEYGLEIDMGSFNVSGCATAGDWAQEMDVSYFRPEQFLRKMDCLEILRDKIEDSE